MIQPSVYSREPPVVRRSNPDSVVRVQLARARRRTPLGHDGLPLIVLAASIAIKVALCFLLFQWDSRPIPARRRLLALAALVPFAVSIIAV